MTHLRKLIHHSIWANETWISFIEQECGSDEHLLRLMSHILLGEQAWFQRIQGDEPDRQIWRVMTISELREMLSEHRGIYEKLLGEPLERVVAYERFSGEKGESTIADILLHLTSHGAHHRGQMATHTSRNGIKPINTDFIQFCIIIKV